MLLKLLLCPNDVQNSQSVQKDLLIEKDTFKLFTSAQKVALNKKMSAFELGERLNVLEHHSTIIPHVAVEKNQKYFFEDIFKRFVF